MTKLQRILHVDDEPDIREIVLIALEILGGFKVLQSDCGENALDVISGYQPDLLLLDVMMPGLSGFETLSKAHELSGFETLPGIFMSAKGANLDIPTILSNVLGTIPKPFDPSTLTEDVTQLWQTRHPA